MSLHTQDPLKREILFEDNQILAHLCGEHSRNIKRLEADLDAVIRIRGNKLTISAQQAEADLAEKVLQNLYELIKSGHAIAVQDVDTAVRMLKEDKDVDVKDTFEEGGVTLASGKRVISPKSLNQRTYMEAIRKNDIVFGIGPAGTGKTYLAMAMAVSSLLKDEVKRIILTRPAVEAGEKLGFLPGDLAEKVNPYLRPLYDALYDMMVFEKAIGLMEKHIIEVAPLAFMRGRTLNQAFIILDEAQNTTSEQMKMFLTRLGYNSKAVITGDVTQIDLPEKQSSGLVEASRILCNIEGIAFIQFTKRDVVRHRLVSHIIAAYEDAQK